MNAPETLGRSSPWQYIDMVVVGTPLAASTTRLPLSPVLNAATFMVYWWFAWKLYPPQMPSPCGPLPPIPPSCVAHIYIKLSSAFVVMWYDGVPCDLCQLTT